MNTDIKALYRHFRTWPHICTDTRQMEPDSIFVALSGPNFDGNVFAAQALENGARLAVVSDPNLTGSAYFHVDDTLHTLQALARFHRDQLDIPVIGITGSNGKTTTKELVHLVLSGRYKTFATRGNLNNHIGVPLSVLGIKPDDEIAVIEMGANHEGEIRALCAICKPTHGVITNIGKAHLEGFGSLEGVKRGKSELYEALAKVDGTAFVNAGVPYLSSLSGGVEDRIMYALGEIASNTDKSMVFRYLHSAEGCVIRAVDRSGQQKEMQSVLQGKYNAENIATATAIGLYFDVPLDVIVERVRTYIPENNRSQRVHAGSYTLLMDAYNANPTSMHLAIESFVREPGDKSLILGEMRELGPGAHSEHRELLDLVGQFDWCAIYLVGALFASPASDLGYMWFADVEALNAYLREEPLQGDRILVKGSRSVQLEKVLEVVQA